MTGRPERGVLAVQWGDEHCLNKMSSWYSCSLDVVAALWACMPGVVVDIVDIFRGSIGWRSYGDICFEVN